MKKRLTPEQIVTKLCQADVELGKGPKVPGVCKPLGVSQQTYYTDHKKLWPKYDGMLRPTGKQYRMTIGQFFLRSVFSLADEARRDGPADGQAVQSP